MLNRLADLKNSTGRPAEPAGEEGEAGGQDVEENKEEEDEEEEELDDDEKAFMEDMQERFQEMLEDEGAAKQAFTEVRNRVDNMQKFVKEAQTALLPSKITTLHNRFESEEIVCQRMIRRAKDTLTTLKAEDEDYEADEVAAIALWPVRQSLAQARQKEFKLLVQGFFLARSHSKEEMLKRTYRQLKFAYPDALDEELRDILEFPEVAIDAIAQRLENGVEASSLDHILEDLEGRKGDSKKLEQGAKELKLMFLQFSELIDTQGEALNSIEANIQETIAQTSEAIDVLQEAEIAKRTYQGNAIKGSCCCMILFFIFVAHPLWRWCNGGGQNDTWYDEISGDFHAALDGLKYVKDSAKHQVFGSAEQHEEAPSKGHDGGEGKEHKPEEKSGKEKSSSFFQARAHSPSIFRNQDSIAQTAGATLGLQAARSGDPNLHAADGLPHAASVAKEFPPVPEGLQVLQGPLRRLVAMSSKGNMDSRQRSALRRRGNYSTDDNSTIRWRTIKK